MNLGFFVEEFHVYIVLQKFNKYILQEDLGFCVKGIHGVSNLHKFF